MTLKQKYAVISKLFDARNERERILIAGATVAVIFSIWQFLFYDPAILAQQKTTAQSAALEIKINSITQQYKLLIDAKQVDPNREIKNRITLAQQHLDNLDQQLQLKMKGLILPTQMASILEQVLTRQTKLQFVRIQSLASKPLLLPAGEPSHNNRAHRATNQTAQPIASNTLKDIGVYQHGIEMEFSGSYLDTLDYLQRLERLSWNFYWDAVLFDTIKYPKSKVIIRVHTLSLKEGWLGV